jgi:hypothetical protein
MAEHFHTELNEMTSLDSAATFATGFVGLCCSEWALTVGADCIKCGGHIHAATITPPERKTKKILTICGARPARNGFSMVDITRLENEP